VSEILFVTWDGGGNVPPAVGIANELQRRGHHVRFLGHQSQAAAFTAAGHPFAGYPTARSFTSDAPSTTAAQLGVFGDRAMGRDVLAELASRQADVVVVDCLLFGVLDALRRAGRPYVVLEHSFDGFFRGAAKGPLGLVLRLRGFRATDLIDSGRLVITTALAELDAGHGQVTHTGPVVTAVRAGGGRPGAEEPRVLISLSTFAFRSLTPTWQRVLDAVGELPASFVATTGPAVEPGALRVPANVELHRWLPHEDVLGQVSLVVGHGGHGTTMAALAHDLPLLLIPLDPKTDQPFVARALEQAGAGRALSRRASPRRIRAAVEELLADGPHRAAAARLGAAIRALPGATNGADRIEALLSNEASAPGRPAAPR
jgi:UDP:flavonoid glycosyltransferase YjiC (YdhE family)